MTALIGQQVTGIDSADTTHRRAEVRVRCECGRLMVIRGGRHISWQEAVVEDFNQDRVATCKGCRVVWQLTFQVRGDDVVVVDAMNCGVLP